SDRAEQWLSSGAMVARLNFAAAMAGNRLKGTKVDFASLLEGIDATKTEAVVSRLVRLTAASEATRKELGKVLQSTPHGAVLNPAPSSPNQSASYTGNDPKSQSPPYLGDLITLLIGSPDFQQR